MKYEKLALEQYRELTKKHLAIHQPWDITQAIRLKYEGVEGDATAMFTGDPTPDTLTLRADSVDFAVLEIDPYATLQDIIDGINGMNKISMGIIASQTNTTNAVSTLGSKDDAAKFQVGDKVTFYDVSAHVLSTEELVVSAVNATARTITCVGVWTVPPVGTDTLIAKAGTVASVVTKAITLDAGDAARFVVGDTVVFLPDPAQNDDLTPLRLTTDRRTIEDITGNVITLDTAFTGTVLADAILAAYRAIGDSFEAELGDQYEGDEDMEIMSLTDPAVDLPPGEWVWFEAESNLQMKITLPAVPQYRAVKISRVVANSTYGEGASKIQVHIDGVKKWEESGGDTTVDKEGTFDMLSVEVGQVAVIRVLNDTAMTAGYLSVSYQQKEAAPYWV